jgi:hypothetical protein
LIDAGSGPAVAGPLRAGFRCNFLNGKILDSVHEFLISKTGSSTGAKRPFKSNLARNKRVAS